MSGRRLISFVVPVFNEEANIQNLYDRVCAVMEPLSASCDFEFIFTDNHSTDMTFTYLTALAAKDSRVRVLRFSRNFGYQRSIFTGLKAATGDAAIQLDCDLQDPPELVPKFIELWREQGFEIVYGIRAKRAEGLLITKAPGVFYWLVNALSNEPIPMQAGDFRLVGRNALNVLASVYDPHIYIRGFLATAGFEQTGIPYERAARLQGESKFPLGQLLKLALDGILYHSILPLRLATVLGLLVATFTLFGVGAYFFGRILYGQEWPVGFATSTILMLFSITLNALFLGVIGEYLGRIYQHLKGGPLTIVERTLNIENSPALNGIADQSLQ